MRNEPIAGMVSDGRRSLRSSRARLGVLKTRAGKLDVEYLRKWAIELKVTDLLERVLKEAG